MSDLKYYAAAVTPEDDAVLDIGGAIVTSKKFDFSDFVGTGQGVSSNTGDTTQTITVTYRTLLGALATFTISLNGQTVVTNSTVMERIEKAVKSATCAGDVAFEGQTAVLTGTLAAIGPEPDQVQLPGGASAVDGFYNGMVFRATGGTGNHKIAEAIDYNGGSKVLTLSRSVAADFDATTTFRISKGVFFDKTPSEITYVVRHDMDSAADGIGGSIRDFFVKGFFKHTDASGSGLALTSCVIKKAGGPAGVTFALDDEIDEPYPTNNGVYSNRRVAPTLDVGGPYHTFDAADKAVPGPEGGGGGGTLNPGDTIGVWQKLDRLAGAAALKTTWTPGLDASTL